MSVRPHNFNAGPAILPLSVLEEARASLADTAGTGLSVLEWSHRSKDYAEIQQGVESDVRDLLGEEAGAFRVLLLQGGASMQFAQVPLNLASSEAPGEYVLTGVWSKKALAEARRIERGREIWSGEESGFTRLPDPGSWTVGDDAAYVHLTTNNTIFGTECRALPDVGDVPLVADMSSDILSGPIELKRLGLLYAGAQKNLGPAGLTLVLITIQNSTNMLDWVMSNLNKREFLTNCSICASTRDT